MNSQARRALTAALGAGLAALLVIPPSGALSVAGTPPTAATISPSEAPTPLALNPADDTVGRWDVQPTDPGDYLLTWVSPTPLPVTDARPEFTQGESSLGAPRLAPDGRTLSLEVSSPAPPDVATLDVVLSGDVLDSSSEPPDVLASAPYVDPADSTTLAADPGEPGTHQVESSSYRLPGFAFRGLPAKLEMLGHVVEPTDADASSPLVLFLHGRHSVCYGKRTGPPRAWPCPRGQRAIPSHLGYDYAQTLLATQGYVTVSISANGINAQDERLADGGAGARAALIRRHLSTWADWSTAGRPGYVADVDRVVLVGHSRGGEGANRATLQTPLSAPYRVAGQVLIGPTDFARQAMAHVHTATVLPYCDGDVSDLQGQVFTDAARDLATGDRALHSSVMMMGANHNFFNTEWTPRISAAPSWDDWGGDPDATCGTDTAGRLSAAEQRRVGRTYIAGAVRLMASRDQAMLPMFDGSAVAVPSAGDADVRTHVVGAGRDVRRLGFEATQGARQGAELRMCAGRATYRKSATACGSRIDSSQAPHWIPDFVKGLPSVRNLEMSWSNTNQWGRIRLTGTPLDLSTASSLDLRTIVDPRRGKVRLQVRLRDSAGRQVTVTPEHAGLLPELPGGSPPLAKRWAQTLRVPLTSTGSVDLSAIVAVDLVGSSADGRLWVLDLAAARTTLPAAARVRATTVSLGHVRVKEGDGPEPTIAEVPYRVRGSVPDDAEIVVLVTDLWTFQTRRPFRVSLTDNSGVIRVPVPADRRDDPDIRPFSVAAYPWDGVMTSNYVGDLWVVDDDPQPALDLVGPRRIREGEAATWRVQLSQPVDYFVEVTGRFVPGPEGSPRLRVADVGRRWVRSWLGNPPGKRPLHKVRFGLYDYIQEGARTARFELPVRRDGRVEGVETVTLRVRVSGLGTLRRTVVVTDP